MGDSEKTQPVAEPSEKDNTGGTIPVVNSRIDQIQNLN